MSTQPAPAPNRFERRRAETRSSLIGAARQLLAEAADADASIQKIAERADVGFGSFYNHFTSKSELFDAAVADALDEYGQTVDDVTSGIEDPAEVFAVSIRLTASMVESHPEIMQILRHRGLGHIHTKHGLAPRALRDLENGATSGRFTLGDPAIALSAVGGALLGLVELRFNSPAASGPSSAEEMAELLLRMLGLSADDAREVARRPLPVVK